MTLIDKSAANVFSFVATLAQFSNSQMGREVFRLVLKHGGEGQNSSF